MPISLILLIVSACPHCQSALADDVPTANGSTPTSYPVDLPKRIAEITEAVLQHHVDPPARQQMVLDGLKMLFKASGQRVPAGLSRRVSTVTTPEQLACLLADIWPNVSTKTVSTQTLEEAVVGGLLDSISGGAQLVSAKERKVAEQLEGNRYVGVQIALAMDDNEKLPFIS
jgi:hypothetical protein